MLHFNKVHLLCNNVCTSTLITTSKGYFFLGHLVVYLVFPPVAVVVDSSLLQHLPRFFVLKIFCFIVIRKMFLCYQSSTDGHTSTVSSQDGVWLEFLLKISVKYNGYNCVDTPRLSDSPEQWSGYRDRSQWGTQCKHWTLRTADHCYNNNTRIPYSLYFSCGLLPSSVVSARFLHGLPVGIKKRVKSITL